MQAIDDDRFGDGETDDQTYPLSRRLEFEHDGNLREQWSRGSSCTKSYQVRRDPELRGHPVRGHYEFTSEVSYFSALVPVERGISSINVALRSLFGPVSLNDFADARLRVEVVDVGASGESERTRVNGVDQTVNTADEYLEEFAFGYDESEQPSAGFVWIRVYWGYGGIPDSDGPADVDHISDYYHFGQPNPFDAFTDDTAMVRFENGASGRWPVFSGVLDPDASSFVTWSVHSAQGYSNARGYAEDTPCCYPLSVEIDIEYDDARPSFFWSPKSDQSMEALEPALGRHTVQQAQNTDAVSRRPRLMRIGPDGGQKTDAPKNAQWRTFWRWVRMNDPNLGDPEIYSEPYLDRGAVQMPGTGGLMDLTGLLYAAYLPGDASPKTWDAEAWADKAIFAEVTTTLTGTVWQGTSSAQAFSETLTLSSMKVWPLNPTTQFYIPNTAYWSIFPEATGIAGGGAPTLNGDGDLDYQRWSHYEGVLHRTDHTLLSTVFETIDVGAVPKDAHLQLDWQVTGVDPLESTEDGFRPEEFCIINTGSTYSYRDL